MVGYSFPGTGIFPYDASALGTFLGSYLDGHSLCTISFPTSVSNTENAELKTSEVSISYPCGKNIPCTSTYFDDDKDYFEVHEVHTGLTQSTYTPDWTPHCVPTTYTITPPSSYPATASYDIPATLNIKYVNIYRYILSSGCDDLTWTA